jgi:hypothetical protein
VDSPQLGRALDVLVAEKVMGLSLDWHHESMREALDSPARDRGLTRREANEGRGVYMRCGGCDIHGYANEVDWSARCPTPSAQRYSTDDAEAMGVVRHLVAQRCRVNLHLAPEGVTVQVVPVDAGVPCPPAGRGETLPLAVCCGALAYVDAKEEGA